MRGLALLLVMIGSGARAEPRMLIAVGDEWAHLPASEAPSGWCDESFDDSTWPRGPSGFGYGDGDDRTELADMRGQHLALALRRRFDATEADRSPANRLVLLVRSDDGFAARLNGVEVARERLAAASGWPDPGTAASDHEASRVERFTLEPHLLRAGENLLCVQAHDSSLHSSDFTIEVALALEPTAAPGDAAASHEPPLGERAPESIPPALRRAPAASRRRTTFATTFAAWHASNYFQGRAGSPKEPIHGQLVRQDFGWRPGNGPWRLALRVDAQRYGSLGEGLGLSLRASRSGARHDAWLSADATLARPAFRAVIAPGEERVASADAQGLQLGWRGEASPTLAISGWLDLSRERLEIDRRRDNHDLLAGASLRFRRQDDVLSPELGVEIDRRDARSPAFEYDQHRVFLRLRSHPLERVWLSAFLRYGLRDYDGAAGPTGDDRRDRRRVARLTCDVRVREHVDLLTFLSWEDGQSSREGGAFEGTFAWAGLRWRP